MIFFICQFFAVRAYRRTRAEAEEERFHALLAKRRAKLAAKEAVTGSVVGKTCGQCERRIVVAHDGCRCKDCSAPLHDGCKAAHRGLEHGNRVGAYR